MTCNRIYLALLALSFRIHPIPFLVEFISYHSSRHNFSSLTFSHPLSYFTRRIFDRSSHKQSIFLGLLIPSSSSNVQKVGLFIESLIFLRILISWDSNIQKNRCFRVLGFRFLVLFTTVWCTTLRWVGVGWCKRGALCIASFTRTTCSETQHSTWYPKWRRSVAQPTKATWGGKWTL